MKSNYLISVNKKEDVEYFKKVGNFTFLFALKDFCVGYNTFSLEEINEYEDSYILINRILDTDAVDKLKDIIDKIKVKGIVYEDIAVFNMVKERKLNLDLIFFQNHFGTNRKSIDYWLEKGIESVFVSNELTYKEIEEICENSSKPLVVQVLGYNQVMYSRRLLLSNYKENFNLVKKREGILEEVTSKIRFRAMENEYGTVLYTDKVFNGLDLRNLDNVLYFYINSTMLDKEDIIGFLKGNNPKDSDEGFLKRETVFKLKGDL